MHGRFLLALLALVQAAVAQRKQIEVLGQPQSRQPLADELKRVFFSGDPWLIECISAENIAAAGADDQPEDYAHSAVQVAMAGRSPLLPAEVNVGLLDCQKRLPSGKNTIERFKLDETMTPLLVLFANAGPPTQLKPAMLLKSGLGSVLFPSVKQQAAALAGAVAARAEPRAHALSKTEQLYNLCVKRSRHCALVLHHGDLQPEAARTLKALLREFRTVAFATLNVARYDLSLLRKLPEVTRGAPLLLGLKSNLVPGEKGETGEKGGKGEKGEKVSGEKSKFALSAKAHRDGFSPAALRSFLSSLSGASGTLEMTPLRQVPSIVWRKQSGAKKSGGKGGGKEGGKDGGKGGGKGGGKDGGKGGGLNQSSGSRSRRAAADPAVGKGKPAGKAAEAAAGAAAEASARRSAQELRRRQQIAEEEEEAVRSMFEGGEGEEDEDEDDFLDFDEEDEEDREGARGEFEKGDGGVALDGSEDDLVSEAVGVDGSLESI